MCLVRLFSFSNVTGHIRPSVLIALILIAMPIRFSIAENLLGLYVGAAAGQSQVEGTAPYNLHFRENHSAFKLMVRSAADSLVGVEIAYNDFGHPNRWNGNLASDVTMKGESASAFYSARSPCRYFHKSWITRIDSKATTHTACFGG